MSFFNEIVGLIQVKPIGDIRTDVPTPAASNFDEKVREAISTMLGNRGNPLDRALTVRDLQDTHIVGQLVGKTVDTTVSTAIAQIPTSSSGTAAIVDDSPDLTPPPTPTGFTASAAISTILVRSDGAGYTQGHGPSKSVLYGAVWTSGPVPTFGNALNLTEYSGSVFSYPTNPATTWHLWLKWVSVDGVESVVPAGGTNGVMVTTGQDVSALLNAINGQITTSELASSLNGRIDLIDGPASLPNSLAQNMGFLRSYANINSKTFRQTAAPSRRGVDPQTGVDIPLQAGDVWIDTSLVSGVPQNKQSQWTGSAWVYSPDAGIAAADARIANVETTKIGYCTLNGSATDHTTKDACTAAGGTWNVGLPIATAVKQVSVSDGTDTMALEQRFTAQKGTNGQLLGSYTIKLSTGNQIAGFGLASESNDAGLTTSNFAIRADRFYVAAPINFSSENTPSPYETVDGSLWYVPSTKKTYRYVAASTSWSKWREVTQAPMFTVQTTVATAANGVQILPGVYIDTAYIKSASITQAQIASVKADSITAGVLQAVVSQTGAIFNGVAAYTFTTDTNTGVVTATATANAPGTAEFGTGYFLGQLGGNPQFFVGSPTNYAYWNGATFTIKGTVYATAGEIGGHKITQYAIESPSYATGGGWILNQNGLSGGNFSTYSWPANYLGGFHIGPLGLLMGNYYSGKYIQISSNGDLYAPGLTIVNGSATFSGDLGAGSVSTDMIVSNAATETQLDWHGGNNGWIRFDFYMRHAGMVYLDARIAYYMSSTGGGSEEFRVGINYQPASGNSSSWTSGAGATKNSLIATSSWLGVGWHTVHIYGYHSAATGTHAITSFLFRSYR